MYSRTQLARKYIGYYLSAQNGKGHGVHSPFVFDFIKYVLNDRKQYPCYDRIEALRKKMLANDSVIEVQDFGAGSLLTPFKKRKIKEIASASLKSKKFAQLLFRIAQYYQCEHIVELGTSLGITTSYFAGAADVKKVYTLEGSANIAQIARENFKHAGLENIECIVGNFDHTLPSLLEKIPAADLLFIDGNHRKEPTLAYFRDFLPKAGDRSVFIFDDIHWSSEMEDAWRTVQQDPEVTLTIDLFFIGLVFFSKDFKVKQHFTIRF